MAQMYRLVTRSDFDGLVCAVLFKELNMVEDILFVHPKDVQDGKIEITEQDILTNLPYAAAAHLIFDHHASEVLRNQGKKENHIIDSDALSTARVVYEHFGGKTAFPNIAEDMMLAVDQADSARFSMEDVLSPSNWVLLNYIMDPRTGLGRFRSFTRSNYDLMMHLIDACITLKIKDILALGDVEERLSLFKEHEEKAREQILRCSTVHNNLVVFDIREEEIIWACNRFLIYALFPKCTISMHVMWGRQNKNTVFAVGKSIFDRSNTTNIGALMLSYGGGGHLAAGTCQVDNDKAESTMQELIRKISG